jgi:hypothetical protein
MKPLTHEEINALLRILGMVSLMETWDKLKELYGANEADKTIQNIVSAARKLRNL